MAWSWPEDSDFVFGTVREYHCTFQRNVLLVFGLRTMISHVFYPNLAQKYENYDDFAKVWDFGITLDFGVTTLDHNT